MYLLLLLGVIDPVLTWMNCPELLDMSAINKWSVTIVSDSRGAVLYNFQNGHGATHKEVFYIAKIIFIDRPRTFGLSS